MLSATHKWGNAVSISGWKTKGIRTVWKGNQDAYILDQKDDMMLVGVLDGHGKHGEIISNIVKDMLEVVYDPTAVSILNEYLLDLSHAQDSGSTVCVGLIQGNMMTLANTGDSTCALFDSKTYKIVNRLHSFQDPSERTRVDRMGGVVKNGRLNGGINLSRAVGDFKYAPYGMIGTPDIYEVDLSEWEYLVFGTDGIFDYVTPAEIQLILYQDTSLTEKGFLIMNKAQKKWIQHTGARYCDDITVIIIPL